MLYDLHNSKYMQKQRQTHGGDSFKLPAQLLQSFAALLAVTLVACSHQVGPFPESAF